jgi:hypothetical protein
MLSGPLRAYLTSGTCTSAMVAFTAANANHGAERGRLAAASLDREPAKRQTT